MINLMFEGATQKKASKITHLCVLGAAAWAKAGNGGLFYQFVFKYHHNDLISIRRELREMFPRLKMRREVLVVRKVVLKVMRGMMRMRKRRKMQARKTRQFRLLQSQKKRIRGHQQRQKQKLSEAAAVRKQLLQQRRQKGKGRKRSLRRRRERRWRLR